MITRPFFLVLLTVLGAFVAPARAALDELEASGLFKEGSDLFEQANAASVDDPEAARELYRKAALRFERIVNEGGVQNGKLYYNIGNAYFRADDIGRAILNYRRAGQFDPHDQNVQKNLDYARSQRLDELAAADDTKALRTLLFWHYDFSFAQRFTLFAIAFVLLWVAAAARLFRKRPFLKWIIGLATVVSVVLGASLLAESLALRNTRPGVVVAEEVTARKGDSDSYEASFQEPLHAGAEFTLVEARKSWMHVELPDGRRCWLPTDSVAMVR